MLVLWTLVLAGCGRGPAVSPTAAPSKAGDEGRALSPPGTLERNLTHEATERTYRLYVPRGGAAPGAPLVIALHGGLGSGNQFAENSRFDRQADRFGFLVAYPDGLAFGTLAGLPARTWNGGRCCGQAAARDVDDTGFLAALIDDLANREGIDRNRVFVTGHSNGAILAFRFACERADLVRAIAPVAGSLEIPACEPGRGVSLLAIHGDADQNHPLDGGTGSRSIAGVPFTSMDHTLAAWTAVMSCSPDPTTTREGPITTTTWAGCRDGTRSSFVVIAGADHPWPGSTPASTALQGTPSSALDASAVVAEFFALIAGLAPR